MDSCREMLAGRATVIKIISAVMASKFTTANVLNWEAFYGTSYTITPSMSTEIGT